MDGVHTQGEGEAHSQRGRHTHKHKVALGSLLPQHAGPALRHLRALPHVKRVGFGGSPSHQLIQAVVCATVALVCAQGCGKAGRALSGTAISSFTSALQKQEPGEGFGAQCRHVIAPGRGMGAGCCGAGCPAGAATGLAASCTIARTCARVADGSVHN